MKDKDNKFEEEWRKAFDSAEEEPSHVLWQNIENKLAQNDIGVYKKKFYYTQAAAAVLLMLILPLLAYFIYHYDNDSIALHTSKNAINKVDHSSKENNQATNPTLNEGENRTRSEESLQSIGNSLDEHSSTVAENSDQLKKSNASRESLDKADLDRHEQNIIALSKEDNKSNSASSKIDQPAFLSEKTGLKEQEDIESTKAEKELKRGNNIADIQKNNGINEGYNREINNEKREKSIGIDSGENDGINKTSIAKNSSQLASTEVETGTRNKNKAVENESSGTKANTSNPSDLTKPDIAKGFNLVSKDNQVIEGERNSIAKSKELVQNYVAELNPVAPKGGQEKEVRLKKMYLYFWQNESLYAQVEIKKENKMKGKRWSANADFTPSYTNQNFEVANTTSPSPGASGAFADAFRTTSQEESAKELEMLSKPQFSYSSGVNSAYRITERLSVEVGVKYIYSQSKVYTNNYVENMTTNDQYPAFNMVLKETPSEEASLYNWNPGTEPEANALYGYNSVRAATNNLSSPSNIDNYKDVNIYTQYVGVPLTINYKLIDKRIGISIGGGVSTDFFLQYGSKKQDGLEAEKISSAENSVFRPYAFSFLLTPEFEYGLSERSSFYLRPIYKGALQSFTDDKKLSNRPNSTGIGFGIRYNFR